MGHEIPGRRNLICIQQKTDELFSSVFSTTEVTAGFEPANQGVADPRLTTWLSHQNSPSRARTYNNSVNSRVLYH